MTKKIIYTILSVFSFMILLYCSEEVSINSNSSESLKKNLSKTSARETNDFTFTKGGNLNLTDSQISDLYQICSDETDFSNIKRVFLYSSGNENDEQNVNVSNLRGISFYKYKDGFLEHIFYKKNNGIFQEVKDLTLKTSPKILMQNIDFVIRYSDLETTQLTVYSSENPSYSNPSIQASNEFKDFMVWDFGSHVKLQESEGELGKRIPVQDKCGRCKEATRGDCTWDISPEDGGWCDPKIDISCRFSFIRSLLSNNNQYDILFNEEKAYEIRDQLFSESLFGKKYLAYYYQTSFGEIDFDFNDSAELANLLPEIYQAYDVYKNNETENVVITEEFSSELISVINKMKTKNSNKKYFVKILDDIIDDINFIKNKKVGEIKNKIF